MQVTPVASFLVAVSGFLFYRYHPYFQSQKQPIVMNSVYNQILLFGDSITQMSFDPALYGFGANLANAYQRKLDVFNRGFSGYNTDWALPLLRQILPTVETQRQTPARIELMTIFFGANDAAIPGAAQHVPLDRYKSNLLTMLDLIKNPQSPYYNPNIRLILITPPPLNEVQWRQRCIEFGNDMDRYAHVTKEYAMTVKELAKEKNIVCADIWSRVTEKAQASENGLADYLFDGLHLNGNGYKELHSLLMELIGKHFPEIHPDALEMEIPWWRDLNRESPNSYEKQLVFPVLKTKPGDSQ
ncbi:SGNH hydrolase [Hesseltinella vesiculosa]|uniref:SGNH hydrolase n=1 Tax=Hesseltinella vesiculosa TaxID=101127 RepID=A0A1X2GMG9_9FUNG|nr:SGNH hydrolase [Hesseltinella vesiculosa]